MTLLAVVLGYALGSLPTAGFLAHRKGVDLRHEGSGNPGTKNALSTGGPALAAAVLLVEASKGYAAVWLGSVLADDTGAVLAGIAAVAGNVFNVWYNFSGGKGLGISLGVLAAAWPFVLPVALGAIVVAVVITRSAGLAALAAMVALIVSAALWWSNQWATGGVEPTGQLVVLALGMTSSMIWKHWRDSPLNAEWRAGNRARV
jgi:acyl phosphate:glycerol-3-phosphate acyltransferase